MEILSLSLFMSWIRTNYDNSPSPTDQSTFFTNFTNRGPDFHICHSLTKSRIYLLDENKFSLHFQLLILPPHTQKKNVEVEKQSN
jgi:hypothetical protein